MCANGLGLPGGQLFIVKMAYWLAEEAALL